MTDGYVTANPAAWASALENLRNATVAMGNSSSGTESDLATDRFLFAQEQLLDLHAPDIMGVIQKLDIIWEADLRRDDLEAEWKMGVLGDLWRLRDSKT